MNEEEIDKKAIETWGLDLQIIVAIEELSELQKALCKYLRNKIFSVSIAEEVADVEIMLNQLKVAWCMKPTVESMKKDKLQKVEDWLKKSKEVMT